MENFNDSSDRLFSSVEQSPMTEISINLSGTKLSDTPLTKNSRFCGPLEDNDLASVLGEEPVQSGEECYTRQWRTRPISRRLSSNGFLKKRSTFLTQLGSESPPRHDTDISLYDGTISKQSSPTCSPLRQNDRPRIPLAECNFNSKDSGLGTSFQDDLNEAKSFQFTEPGQVSLSPVVTFTPINKKSVKTSLFHSSMSIDSNGEEFVELLDLDSVDEENDLPINFGTLISGSILSDTDNNTPKNYGGVLGGSRVRGKLFQSPEKEKGQIVVTPVLGKRAKEPDSNDYVEFKRRKQIADCISDDSMEQCVQIRPEPQLSPNSVMSALQRSSTDPDLIGDFTRSFALPLISGRHADLKSISSATLAQLIRGEFKQIISSFKVIDCRFPYEFEGGHIVGALNYYKKEQIMSELFNPMKENCPTGNKIERHIVIFHCEFSSQRGPSLFRYLREIDRTHNSELYPALHYPEIYLLDGGYKGFFEQFSELCNPQTYRTMNDPAHAADYRHFRSQVQSRSRKMSKRSIFA